MTELRDYIGKVTLLTLKMFTATYKVMYLVYHLERLS